MRVTSLMDGTPTWSVALLASENTDNTVRSGHVVAGNVEITNRGAAPFFMDTGQPLQVLHRSAL